MKKVLSFLLSLCLVVTLIPAVSFAADEDQSQNDVEMLQTQEEETEAPVEPTEPELQSNGEEETVVDENTDETPAVDSQEPTEEESEEVVLQAMDVSEGEWVQDPDTGKWQYQVNGVPLTSLQVIGGSWYLFDANGFMLIGLQTFDGSKYYFDQTGNTPGVVGSTYGVRKTGWVNVPNAGKCYFNPMMLTGWQSIGGQKYYLDPRTGAAKTGWQTISGYRYYFNAYGMMLSGWQTINKNRYYFNPTTGRMKTGWATIGSYKYYFNSNGTMKKGWASISGSKYYFNSNGTMKKGWLTVGKNKYYLDASNGKMKKGWATISGKKYFFNAKSGVMVKGWLKYKKKKYYMSKKSGVMLTGLRKISKVYYYFNKSNGVMKKNGCERINKKLYYFRSSGKAYMSKGWFTGSDRKKRYSLGKGVVATGKKKIGSTWYVFSSTTGERLKTIGDDFDKKIQSKTSGTRYLIAVSKSRYQVRVYTGSKNNWVKQKTFYCAIGAPGTPTRKGTYRITKKVLKTIYDADGVSTRYWYNSCYSNDTGMHSGLYYNEEGDAPAYDARVGVKSTNGDIRLSLNNALWIYNNVPLYTTVAIY